MAYAPPNIHSFPPFYTLQPNEETQIAQLDQWAQILLKWAEFNKVWSIDQNGTPIDSDSTTSTIFTNDDIDRKCSQELISKVFKQVIKSGNGIVDSDNNLLILPKSIQFYSNELKSKLESNGLTNVMLTIYELQQDYTNLPMSHLKLILDNLQDSGFIKIVRDDDDGEGSNEVLGIKIS